MSIDVTVVTRCSDPGARSAATLRSALAQQGVSLELVVVNRLPPERPPESLPELRDERVVVLSNAGLAGLTADRNRGLRAARAEWIALLEEGDLWAPDHLAGLIGDCEAAGAELGFSASWALGEDRQIQGYLAAPPAGELDRVLLSGAIVPSPSVVVARNELVRRGGAFDEWLGPLAPWDLWLRWSRCVRTWHARDAPSAAVGDDGAADRAVIRAERRELGRRYGGDARAAGVRFGRAYGTTEPAPGPEAQTAAPWLASLLAPVRRTARS